MKFLHSILLLSLVAGCATKKEVRSVRRVEVPITTLAADDMPEVRPVGAGPGKGWTLAAAMPVYNHIYGTLRKLPERMTLRVISPKKRYQIL
jgi:hypothetical protein